MPELLEVEQYRAVAEQAVGRSITGVHAPDAWYLKGGLDAPTLAAVAVGSRVLAARRRGKLLLLDLGRRGSRASRSTAIDITLGLRFGMTGRLLLDGSAPIERLEYGSTRDHAGWDRVVLSLSGGGDLRIRDPRRLGGVELEPDEEALGPDAATVTQGQLRHALASQAPLKARLMDQRCLAGMGNLLTDECLWRAGFDPARRASSLDRVEIRRLHHHLRRTLTLLGARGGSHLGDLQASRHRGGVCPRDGAPLQRRSIGGRTTYSCPVHQR
jgi:formamidopyrimidine-DNA glycosylase